MKAAIDQFRQNVRRARNLADLADYLLTKTTAAVDVSDILRASLVLGVSALDNFVHDFVRLGMLEVYKGERSSTPAHNGFQIDLSAVGAAVANPTDLGWLDQAIRKAHGWRSFQHPDKIADALRLMSEAKLWEAVGNRLKMSPAMVRTELAVIVDRRNKIAHEADMHPVNPGERWPIDVAQVRQSLHFLETVGEAIYVVA